ncbi:MAG: hypothetical protein RJA99_4298 [Pseudomonadota bacterium]|jgi:hypothetical protein
MTSFLMAADRKLIDEVHHIPRKRGNGQLRREAWVDAAGTVTRYDLACVNPAIHAADNGRVVGYDNQHGYHHRHWMGVVSPVDFKRYDDLEERFEADWIASRNPK